MADIRVRTTEVRGRRRRGGGREEENMQEEEMKDGSAGRTISREGNVGRANEKRFTPNSQTRSKERERDTGQVRAGQGRARAKKSKLQQRRVGKVVRDDERRIARQMKKVVKARREQQGSII
eukprot:509685-Hanusia_phi.AAC.1